MARCEIKVTVTLTNERSLKALSFVYWTLKELEEDLPWRDDVKKAIRALTYAKKNLGVNFSDGD